MWWRRTSLKKNHLRVIADGYRSDGTSNYDFRLRHTRNPFPLAPRRHLSNGAPLSYRPSGV